MAFLRLHFFLLLLIRLGSPCWFINTVWTVQATEENNGTITKAMLDDMAQFFGEGDYPDRFFRRIQDCMHKWDDDELEKAQNQGWQLFLSFLQSDRSAFRDRFFFYEDEQEDGESVFGSGNRTYKIKGKCNYVSNSAYYRSAIRVCDYPDWKMTDVQYRKSMKQMYMALAFASSCFHGSRVRTSCGAFDRYASALIPMLAYEISTSSIVGSSTASISSIFRGLVENREPILAVELADIYAYLPLRDPNISEWRDFVTDLPTRGSYMTITTCLLSFVCGISVPFAICDLLLQFGALPLLSDTDRGFVENSYVPVLKDVLEEEELPLSPIRGIPLLWKFLPIFFSNFLAVYYGETLFEDAPLREGETFNTTSIVAAFVSPVLERISQFWTGYEQTDRPSGTREGMYPGANFCNKNSPHALWHQESSEATFDLFPFAEEVNIEVKRHRRAKKERRSKSSNSCRLGGGC